MSDLPRPETQRHLWQIKSYFVYLPLTQIHSAAAGQLTRQVFDPKGTAIEQHPEHGFLVHKDYFMTELKLEDAKTTVDLWQVADIVPADTRRAWVTLRFCAQLENNKVSTETTDEELKQKYHAICTAATAGPKGS